MRVSRDRAELGYDATIRQYGGDVELAPIDAVTLRASVSRFRADSTILFRRPENFTTDTSINVEKGNALEGGVTLTFPRFSFDGNLARFENQGTLPFRVDRSRTRVTFQLLARTGLAAEWAHDKYHEAPVLGDYEADRYGICLRLTP